MPPAVALRAVRMHPGATEPPLGAATEREHAGVAVSRTGLVVMGVAVIGAAAWAAWPHPAPQYLGDMPSIDRSAAGPAPAEGPLPSVPAPVVGQVAPAAAPPLGTIPDPAATGPLVDTAPPLGAHQPTPNTGTTVGSQPGAGAAPDQLPGLPNLSPALPGLIGLTQCDLTCLQQILGGVLPPGVSLPPVTVPPGTVPTGTVPGTGSLPPAG